MGWQTTNNNKIINVIFLFMMISFLPICIMLPNGIVQVCASFVLNQIYKNPWNSLNGHITQWHVIVGNETKFSSFVETNKNSFNQHYYFSFNFRTTYSSWLNCCWMMLLLLLSRWWWWRCGTFFKFIHRYFAKWSKPMEWSVVEFLVFALVRGVCTVHNGVSVYIVVKTIG